MIHANDIPRRIVEPTVLTLITSGKPDALLVAADWMREQGIDNPAWSAWLTDVGGGITATNGEATEYVIGRETANEDDEGDTWFFWLRHATQLLVAFPHAVRVRVITHTPLQRIAPKELLLWRTSGMAPSKPRSKDIRRLGKRVSVRLGSGLSWDVEPLFGSSP